MNKPLVVIVGETASGKSSLAMTIAAKYSGEIISADSWAVYRGMDIGTAKPSAKDRKTIRHHLINIVEPDDDYTAGLYKEDALIAMNQIYTRKKIPILTGGTGLYIDGVIYDFSFMKAGDRNQRNQYNMMSIKQLISIINQKGYDLTGVDTRNKRRLIRVIETEGSRPKRSNLRNNTLVIGLKINRSVLRKNIETRVERMFRKGLKFEVLDIAGRYGWDCEGMQGIGYKEFYDWHRELISMQKVKQRVIRNTVALAKRQRTWFKKNMDILWVADEDEAMKLVEGFLKNKAIIDSDV